MGEVWFLYSLHFTAAWGSAAACYKGKKRQSPCIWSKCPCILNMQYPRRSHQSCSKQQYIQQLWAFYFLSNTNCFLSMGILTLFQEHRFFWLKKYYLICDINAIYVICDPCQASRLLPRIGTLELLKKKKKLIKLNTNRASFFLISLSKMAEQF